MQEFLAQKFHATGFDKTIEGGQELEDRFISECDERFGINLDRDKMRYNKGKRSLAKLALNNLWYVKIFIKINKIHVSRGRFSMRNHGLIQTRILTHPAELGDMLDTKTIEIKSIDELTPQVVMVSYAKKEEWVEEHSSSNVMVSLWTTSCARLLLLKLMQAVNTSNGCTLLYTGSQILREFLKFLPSPDTDSIIFAHPEGKNPFEQHANFPTNIKMPPILARALPADWLPLIGPHLGDLTDEFPGDTIVEYVSGGAKQCGLKVHKRGTPPDQFIYILKIRGITLNYSVLNDQGLRYETFKESVLEYVRTGKPPLIKVHYPNFICSSVVKARVLSKPLTKAYKPYTCKGVICPKTFNVLNFGHLPCPRIPSYFV